jgi:beta-xylosidase
MEKSMKKSEAQGFNVNVLVIALAVLGAFCFADNPLVQTKYTADPAPMVYNDTVYLYTTHDEDDATGFKMFNWLLYSSKDMVNWTDHGIIAGVAEPTKTFKWADGHSAWAPQCIARNGKFYFYVPTILKGRMAIGVAVADSPWGPFVDPLEKPLIYRSNPSDYDPSVFIDDDGQAYLYWGGNGPCFYAKLNEDMISISGDIQTASIDFTGTPREASYTEGPWLWKKDNHYYLAWASRCCPEGIGYAMSDSPEGPWKCKGTIMDPNPHSDGNHPGILDYKGTSYVFGLNYELFFTLQGNRKKKERRSVCVKTMTYNADGTIEKVSWWGDGTAIPSVPQVGTLNPYVRTEAETICWSSGVKTESCSAGGMNVCNINNGDFIKVKGVDFGSEGAAVFTAGVASAGAGGVIELHLDDKDGKLIGSVSVANTGGWQDWKNVTTKVSDAAGIHDLYFVFKGDNTEHLFNFDSWKFSGKNAEQDPAVGSSAAGDSAEAAGSARNPIIWADVPDPAVIRVDDTYYMSSTTMHMCPGLPIMKSKDLVNWDMVGYAYQKLEDNDTTVMQNGKNMYGRGSWASSLRYHDGMFYVTMYVQNTGKTYVFKTSDIESGKWEESTFMPALHDASLFFDDDGRVYMIYGGGKLTLVELLADLSGIKPNGVNKIIIENANLVFGENEAGGLNGEGSQMIKVNGKYYLLNIASPKSRWSRSVLVHRADKIAGPYEGRVALEDKGVAQGCLIDTPDGKWYAMLFQDSGSVGRCPWLVPVKWEDGWPIFGIEGKAPATLDIAAANTAIPACVASDEFEPGQTQIGLPWQWNHNPDNRFWSLTQRPGFLRLTTGRVDTDFQQSRNMLTQRTFGPQCSGAVALDVRNMKDGDVAGLAAMQKRYGIVGVKMTGDAKSIIMVSAESESPVELANIPLTQNTVFLKVDCDFEKRTDKAYFSYSLDGQTWTTIGKPLQMAYTFPHFMGYRFALFNYAAKTAGGFADFDYFRVSNRIDEQYK